MAKQKTVYGLRAPGSDRVRTTATRGQAAELVKDHRRTGTKVQAMVSTDGGRTWRAGTAK